MIILPYNQTGSRFDARSVAEVAYIHLKISISGRRADAGPSATDTLNNNKAWRVASGFPDHIIVNDVTGLSNSAWAEQKCLDAHWYSTL